jgi:hypothetical protein
LPIQAQNTNEQFSPSDRGLYVGKYPLPGGGGLSADVIWEKKYEMAKRKRGKMKRKRKKGERKGRKGNKMRKGEVKG